MQELSPKFEKKLSLPQNPEQLKEPEKKSEISNTKFLELVGGLARKMNSEAQTLFTDNSKKGKESVKALGGSAQETAELAKLQEPIKLDIEDLVRKAALKLQVAVGLNKQTIETPQDGKPTAATESNLKKIINAELKVVSLTPMGFALKPAIRLLTEKDYRDYVLKKAPELAPVLAKAIATDGASLTNPRDIKVLVDFAVNDPKSPEWMKKWVNKLLASKEGDALISKASSKISKKEKSL